MSRSVGVHLLVVTLAFGLFLGLMSFSAVEASFVSRFLDASGAFLMGCLP